MRRIATAQNSAAGRIYDPFNAARRLIHGGCETRGVVLAVASSHRAETNKALYDCVYESVRKWPLVCSEFCD